MDTCRSTIIVLPSGIGEPRKKISSSQESTVNDQEGPVGEDAGEQVEQRAIGASPSRLCWGEHRTRSGSQALPFTFRQRLSLRAPWCGRDRA